MYSKIGPFWPPLTAGIALGVVLFVTFLISGHGLGASGFFTRFAAWAGGKVAGSATQANAYLGAFLKGGAGPLASWITWEIVGVALGGGLAAIAGGRFRLRLDGAPRLDGPGRLAFALGGGMLTGFGARLHQRHWAVRRCAAGGGRLPVSHRLLHRRHRGELSRPEGLGMSIPIYDNGVASGLFSGVLFGYVLENAGFASPRKLTAQFRFEDWSVFKVMFTAIIVAAVGLYAVTTFGAIRPHSVYIPTTFFWATLTAAR
ncbi:MAG: YeeE/YedE thiosulfate transporter family protein [Pseudolabrys sp.]